MVLIRYLKHKHPSRFYDEIELARLQIVFEQACLELGLDSSDPARARRSR